MNLKTKLALFNLGSKLVFSALFIGFLPYLVTRISTVQTDNELINKREDVIAIISEVGIEPLITSDSIAGFGSYNILKEEFISLEKADLQEDWNFIEVTQRSIEEETIDYRVLNYSFKIDGQTYLLEIGKSLASIKFTEKNITRIILIFLSLFILITLLSDLFYTARLLRPLKVITGKLKGTSNPALFDRKPVKSSTSDFVRLDTTIRDLMSEIDDLFRKEKEITVNISHELLTPVSVLRSKLENMLLRKDIDPDLAVGIDEALRTLHRLKTLVNSLLMIARIESRQYLKEESFNIVNIAEEVIEEILPIANDAGISVENEFDGEFLLRDANRSLIFSMIYNVVNNAVKNTPSGGSIIIKGQHAQHYYNLSVSDTGKGMTQEQVENLFQRFRVKHSEENEKSSGIGLAITKTIADFHKIETKVFSEPGRGTKFIFWFPASH